MLLWAWRVPGSEDLGLNGARLRGSPLLWQNLETQPLNSKAQILKFEAWFAKSEAQLLKSEAQPAWRPKVTQKELEIPGGARFLTPWAGKAVRVRISEAALRGFGQRASDGTQQGGG